MSCRGASWLLSVIIRCLFAMCSFVCLCSVGASEGEADVLVDGEDSSEVAPDWFVGFPPDLCECLREVRLCVS